MTPLPPEAVLRAARRWTRLLRVSSFAQAEVLIRSSASYTDLSPTQYALALEWLTSTALVVSSNGGPALAAEARMLPEREAEHLLFVRSLELARPAWLADADTFVVDESDIPADATRLADVLGIDGSGALNLVRRVHGRVDLAERQRVGALGEQMLVALLEQRWPGSCVHVALDSDSFGFDIVFAIAGQSWHLEVKSTSRRGRLVVHLSRHEYEVRSIDPLWRLVVVGLDEECGSVAGLATVPGEVLSKRVPRDVHARGRWESARFDLTHADLSPGLVFVADAVGRANVPAVVASGYNGPKSGFAWLPME